MTKLRVTVRQIGEFDSCTQVQKFLKRKRLWEGTRWNAHSVVRVLRPVKALSATLVMALPPSNLDE